MYNGIDELSLIFLLLVSFIIPICFLINYNYFYSLNFKVKFWYKIYYNKNNLINIKYKYNSSLEKIRDLFFNKVEFYSLATFILIELLMILLFSTLDLFFFFFFYESIILPMILLLLLNGSRFEKVRAINYFSIYTLLGSIFMIIGIFKLINVFGTTNYLYLYNINIDFDNQCFLWWCFFIPFAIKIPIIPFHLWLPEAHVEASTTGSIILAALLLKLGGYGLIRINLNLLPLANLYYSPIVLTLAIISIIYISIIIIRQVDLKKIIAYSSVIHMNVILIGIFSNNLLALQGSIFLMFSHGLISSALFICVGILYDKYKTRIIFYYSGLVWYMPILSIIFFFLLLANCSFPSTSNFIGEILILNGSLCKNKLLFFYLLLNIFFSIIYSIWFYNKIFLGNIKLTIKSYSDINFVYIFLLLIFCFFILLFGLFSVFPELNNIILVN